LAASAVLHAMILWPGPLPRAALPLAQPLTATLRPPSLPAAPKATAVASEVPVVPSSRPVLFHEPVAIASRVAKLTAERREKLPQAVAVEEGGIAPASPAAPLAPAAIAASAALANGGADASTSGGAHVQDGVDGDALRQFRFAVVRRIGKPDFSDLEKDLGEGRTAVVTVAIGQDGGVQSVTVTRSSGNARVDAVAQDLISAGVRTTALPGALRGRQFATDFPTQFQVRSKRRDDPWEQ
jgi:TonB family protein